IETKGEAPELEIETKGEVPTLVDTPQPDIEFVAPDMVESKGPVYLTTEQPKREAIGMVDSQKYYDEAAKPSVDEETKEPSVDEETEEPEEEKVEDKEEE
ncbi:MAG: hypothetical protein KAQ96_00860, partial [Thermoplasmata archaeon]|nr:hypothetical protein [Thermoplasmata archaeon]